LATELDLGKKKTIMLRTKAKKAELMLVREPYTADDIDALFKALTGSQTPMTEEERRQVEAILAEESPTGD
jgi:hypothetical protein